MILSIMLNNKYFAPLFWTQFLGAFNDNFLKNALIVIVTFHSLLILGLDAKSIVPIAGALFIFPYILFSGLAGELADKYEKKRLVLYTKIWELLISIFAAIGFLTDHYTVVLMCLFMTGIQSTFFGPLKYSLLPQHLGKKHELISGNAYIQLGTNLAILAGTVGGGLLIMLPYGDLITSLLLLFISIAGIFSCLKIPLAPPYDSTLVINKNLLASSIQVCRDCFCHKGLKENIFYVSYFWFMAAIVLNLLPIYTKDILNVESEVYTFFLAVFCLSVGVGSLIIEKLSGDEPEFGLTGVSVFSFSISLFALGFLSINKSQYPISLSYFLSEPVSYLIIFFLCLLALSCGIFAIPFYANLQKLCPQSFQSRVMGANNVLNAVFIIAASMVVILFNALSLSANWQIIILGLFNILPVIYFSAKFMPDLARILSRSLCAIFYDVNFRGRENLPAEGSYIIASNHISFIDWIFIYAACPRPVYFIIDYNYFFQPIIKTILAKAGIIPIATKGENKKVLIDAFKLIDQSVIEKKIIGLFPEGALSNDGHLGPLQNGIQTILKRNPIPIVPIRIEGLWGSYFTRHKGKALSGIPNLKRRKIDIYISQPISPEDFSLDLLTKQLEKKNA